MKRIETIKAPKILLCSIKGDDIDDALLAQDRSIYQDHYENIIEYKAEGVIDFYRFTQSKAFDIVHLFVKLEPGGTAEKQPVSHILRHLAMQDVKLVIFARNNSSEARQGFRRSMMFGIKINFIVVLDRKGESFSRFFRELFGLVASGMSFLMAWVKLAPQTEGPWMENLPRTYGVTDRGDLKFIP